MKRTKARWAWQLMAMLVVGIVGVLVSVALPEGWITDLSTAFSTAVFGVALLGLTADWWLKQELLKDAFNATFGYLLPEELRGELQWLYSQALVCSAHYQDVTVERTDDPNLVLVTTKSERTLRNIRNTPLSFQPPYAIDEWGHKGRPSRILDMGCSVRGQRHTSFSVRAEPTFLDARLDDEIKLEPEESCDVWCVGQETKRLSDDIRDVFVNATHNPRITVSVPPGFEFEVGFGSPRSEGQRHIGDSTVQLEGTLLPLQAVTVRWWPSAQRELFEADREIRSNPQARAA
jgi:hypothetical protein